MVRKSSIMQVITRKFTSIFLILSLLLSIGTVCTASTPKERQQDFNIVWSRVNERFYDPTFNGVDWKAVKVKYSKKMSSVKSNAQLYELLNRMLSELKCSHFVVIPPSEYESKQLGSNNDTIGMSVRLVEGHPTITHVEKGSPAARAGLKPGFVLIQIGDKSMADVQSKIAARKEREPKARFSLVKAVIKALAGPVGSKVSISYLDHRNILRRAIIEREEPLGEPIDTGDFPVFYVNFESKRLQSDIGYMRFNIFLPVLMEKIQNVVALFHDSPGIIIDLRGNSGGVNQMASEIAGLFIKEQVLIGKSKLRFGEIKHWSYPAEKTYTGKVVVLIDEASASTSEALAACLQETGRAVVVGQTSLGALAASAVEKLPTGARLQYVVADFETAKGVKIEGKGVTPDITVEPTRKELLEGHDPALEKAIEVIVGN